MCIGQTLLVRVQIDEFGVFARDRKWIGFSVGIYIYVVCLRQPKTTCFSVAIG